LALVGAVELRAAEPANSVPLDDFEADSPAWRYVGGEEFPGARGSLGRDAGVAHGGKGSYRLEADFRQGGEYVGGWRDLATLGVRDVEQIRFWAKSKGVVQIGVRLNDSTGQCHQTKGIALKATDQWQEVILKVDDLVGGEHWGGANDGKWHGPPQGFGINLAKRDVTEGQGTLWIDDLTAIVVPPGVPAAVACTLSQPSCRPDFGVDITYRWDAEPLGRNYKAFVHLRHSGGKMMFQDDHDVPVDTADWNGRVEYQRTIVIPTNAPAGEYSIVAGLWDSAGKARVKTKAGEGVVAAGENAYRIGTLTLADDAPVPKLGPRTLDLSGYRMTFDEDFSGPELSVSAWGPGTRWIAHTPYAGDFGDARFADPTKGFPFTIDNGILRIEARKTNNRWQSGLLASVDPKGKGFSQQYGYFEARAKFPKGLGTWPAFWLLGAPKLQDKSLTQIEIDVVEFYGVHPNALHTNVHLWYPDKRVKSDGRPFVVTGMTDAMHDYGVMVDAESIRFYFDGVEFRRVKTPDDARVPLYLLVNLALGGGWPIDETPNPSIMEVEHVRAYAK
jgi:hypothetical protein